MFLRFQRFFTQLKVLLDLVMLLCAFGLAYSVRFWSHRLIPFESPSPWNNTIRTLATILVLYPLAISSVGLYRAGRTRSFMDELFGLSRAWLIASMALLSVTYFFQPVRYSRLVLLFFFVLSLTFLTVGRYCFRAALHAVRRRGFNLKDVLVVGAGHLGARVVRTLQSHKELGFRMVGVLADSTDSAAQEVEGVPVIGHLRDLARILDERRVDEVLIALPLESQGVLREMMEILSSSTADVKIIPDYVQYVTLSGGIEEFGGLPLLSLQGDPFGGWNSVAKRAFDVAFSSLALLLALPLMLVCSAALWFTERGPIFYRQERMGMDGRLFTIVKFRTMRPDAEVSGARMAAQDDPRTTLLGRWMRRFSLDELPQLLNVLRGEMSLVGPRPERPVFIEEFRRQIPRYHLRHKVKAGLTGWAQVNGLRGQTSIEKRIEYDLYYIENWSILLDLKILVRTVVGGFLSKNAY
jgi:Undecaprenyl-phosphate glucose phosphotransferase